MTDKIGKAKGGIENIASDKPSPPPPPLFPPGWTGISPCDPARGICEPAGPTLDRCS